MSYSNIKKMEGRINKDIKAMIYNLLFKYRTMKCCTKYKDTYEQSPLIDGAILIKHTRFYAFNHRVDSYFEYIWNHSTKRDEPTYTNYKLPKNYYN